MNLGEAATALARRSRRAATPGSVAATAAALVLGSTLFACSPSTATSRASGTPVTVIATAAPVPTATPVQFVPLDRPSKPGYRLAFHDEFTGPKWNDRVWATSLPWGNTNGDEQQYYTPAAVSQRGGLLTLTARRQDTRGMPYSSGIISTFRRYSFTYGYVEMRAKMPAGTGLWSAFWLPPTTPGSFEEIDVMELLGSDPSQGFAVLHYGSAARRGKSVGSYRSPDFSTGFHTFAIDWSPGSLVWYVDGVERHRVSENVPSTPMYLIANLAVGGQKSWSGAVDRYTEFPAQFQIDYIRVFQRE